MTGLAFQVQQNPTIFEFANLNFSLIVVCFLISKTTFRGSEVKADLTMKDALKPNTGKHIRVKLMRFEGKIHFHLNNVHYNDDILSNNHHYNERSKYSRLSLLIILKLSMFECQDRKLKAGNIKIEFLCQKCFCPLTFLEKPVSQARPVSTRGPESRLFKACSGK